MDDQRSRQRAAARSVRARMIAFRNSSSPASAGSTGLGYVTCGGSTGGVSIGDATASVVRGLTAADRSGISGSTGADRADVIELISCSSARTSSGGFDDVATATAGSGCGVDGSG